MRRDRQRVEVNVARSAYPLRIEWFRPGDIDGVRPLLTHTVRPGMAANVPAMGPCWVRITYTDGTTEDSREREEM